MTCNWGRSETTHTLVPWKQDLDIQQGTKCMGWLAQIVQLVGLGSSDWGELWA